MSVFDGLKVIDAASFIAAPGAATILGDFGAEVVKIEPPGEGDSFRKIFRMPNMPVCDTDYMWSIAARNKRGLALDLKHAEGRAVLHRLVATADVLVTNSPPAVRERLGLGWSTVHAINPRLVYASLTGYGEHGPEANRPGFDANAFWARCGITDYIRPDPDGPPTGGPVGMGDQLTALALYGAIVTALYERERTGQGRMVSTSLLAAGAWANGMSIQAALCGGEIVYRRRRDAPRNALSNYYRCRDGRWFLLSLVAEDRDWLDFVGLIGRAELADDPRFLTTALRREHAPALTRELDAAFAERDSAQWQRMFEDAGHTVGVVARTGDTVHDPQMRIAGAIVPAEGIAGATHTVDSPMHLAGVHKRPKGPAPAVGQHSEDVLRAHGFDDEAIARLRALGVVG